MNTTEPVESAPVTAGSAQPAKGALTANVVTPAGPILADPVLGLMADMVDDYESVRIANSNRLRQLCADGTHGHGMSTEHPEVRKLAAQVEQLQQLEHQAVLALQRAMRAHPLGGWVKTTKGVGEKQAARLLAAIRDPYWNDLHERPRTLYELWAYCGFHTVPADGEVDGPSRVAPRRRRGHKVNWNTQARQRVWLVAQSCIKVTDSPYRDVYDATRLKYADAVHAVECVRCGPAGKPAQPGTPLSAGHQHGRATRAMCKEILRDLWREAANIHTNQAQEGN
jgi:hypothetical protein